MFVSTYCAPADLRIFNMTHTDFLHLVYTILIFRTLAVDFCHIKYLFQKLENGNLQLVAYNNCVNVFTIHTYQLSTIVTNWQLHISHTIPIYLKFHALIRQRNFTNLNASENGLLQKISLLLDHSKIECFGDRISFRIRIFLLRFDLILCVHNLVKISFSVHWLSLANSNSSTENKYFKLKQIQFSKMCA
jgi:hypothetical protein